MTIQRAYESGLVYERNPFQSPNAPLGFAGQLIEGNPVAITVADSPYTVPEGVGFIRVDASGGAVIINLPPSQSYWLARKLTVLRTDLSDNAVTITRGGSDTINGGNSVLLSGRWNKVNLLYAASTVWYADYQIYGGGRGIASVAGDFVLTGWGTGAAVGTPPTWSDDRHGLLTITTGTGASANPTVAHTIPSGRSHSPHVILQPGSSATPAYDQWIVNASTGTLVTWQYIGTPPNGYVCHVYYRYSD